MKIKKVTAHVISSPDLIAWLYNIRGNDIPYHPFVIAHSIIWQDNAILFADLKKDENISNIILFKREEGK